MAYLEISYPNGTTERIALYKRLSILGQSSDADVELKDASLSSLAAISRKWAKIIF
jgi:hypothetical protein